ncbi:MAG: tyrosine-protein phosphatase [Elusimicrobia bacterium]|nr:tyrosine-protein phosphatase [Elusimicrobiota bacterium]
MELLLYVLLAVPLAAQPLQKVPGEQVRSDDAQVANFHRVDIGKPGVILYRSASPVRPFIKKPPPHPRAKADAVMRHLHALGIRTIVSLEDPGDPKKNGKVARSVRLEKEAAKDVGIRFAADPMRNARFKTMTDAQITAWLEKVKKSLFAAAKRGPVLYHCAAGHDRTGLVTAYLRVTEQGWTAGRAVAEMRRYGHNWKKFSSDGGKSSWHEDYLRKHFPGK